MKKKAFTLIEILIGVAILGIIMMFGTIVFRWTRITTETIDKADVSSRLRNSSVVIARQLQLATEYLYPSRISENDEHLIIFRDELNQIITIFLDDDGVLSSYNHSSHHFDRLIPFTVGFKVRRVDYNLIEYQIDIEKDEFSFSLKNSLSTCNTLP